MKKSKKLIAMLLTLLMLLSILPVAAFAAGDSINYIDANGVEKTATATKLTEGSTSWSGWVYADGEVTISQDVTLASDEVNLILADGASLTVLGSTVAKPAIIGGGKTFNIYAQTNKTGKLSVKGIDTSDNTAGYGVQADITVYSGIVDITGGNGLTTSNGQGRSGGNAIHGSSSAKSSLAVYGGKVTVTGGTGGNSTSDMNKPGVGGYGMYNATLAVYGGEVTVASGNNGNAVNTSKGAQSTVAIYGGDVSVSGSGKLTVIVGTAFYKDGNYAIRDNVTLSGGELTVIGGDATGDNMNGGIAIKGNLTVSGGTATIKGGNGTGSGRGGKAVEGTVTAEGVNKSVTDPVGSTGGILTISSAPTIDLTTLEAAIAAFEALTEEDYTANSWTAAKAAYDAAVEAKTATTQTDVNNAVTALNNAIKALEKKVEGIDFEGSSLLLAGDIGLYFWCDIPESMRDGITAEMSIGSRNPRTEKKDPGYDSARGLFSFPLNVNSIQMAEPVTVTLKDSEGKELFKNTGSVEEYNKKVQDSQSVSANEKALVKALVNYGYYAQQSLSVANGWSIGKDYAATAKQGDITATAADIAKFKPIITGSSETVKGVNLRLALDNKTNFYIYFTTSDKEAPNVTIDGVTATLRQDGERFVATIPNIDALSLGTVHVIEAGGYTLYLSPLSYGSTITGQKDIDTVLALIDYYYAALTYAGRTVITSATAADATYTGEAIAPTLTVTDYKGNPVTDYTVEWDGELKEIGTYAGIVKGKNTVSGVVPVSFTINPIEVVPPMGYYEEYDGQEHSFTEDDYSNLVIVTGTEKAKDAGEYSVTVKPVDNYCWSDGTQDKKTIDWSIEKVSVTVTANSAGKKIGEADPELQYNISDLEAAVADREDTGKVSWNIELSREEGETRGDYDIIATVFEISGEAAKNYDVAFAGDHCFSITGEEVALPRGINIDGDGNKHCFTNDDFSNLDVIGGQAYATDAGNYSVTLKPKEGYCWSDGTQAERIVYWSIVSNAIMTSIVK